MIELIKTILADAIRKMAAEFKGPVSVDIAENKENGDYTTNVAFGLAKFLKKSPQEAAEELAGKLESAEFSKIEAKNGFVNFFLSEDCLDQQLNGILKQKNKYGFSKYGAGKKIQVEFISANPTGPMTIGNGRGGFYGDVLANVLASQGYKVEREYYINDRGEQVIALGRSIKLARGEKVNLPEGAEENLYKGDYIKELASKIGGGLNEAEAGRRAVEMILKKHIKPAAAKLKIKFDNWFSERGLYKKKLISRSSEFEKTIGELIGSGFVYEKDGATWLATSRFGDSEDRVLIKKDGAETYFLSDILYHRDKFKARKFEKVIDIWGADHHGYAPRLKAALKILGIPEENLEIIITQLVRLVSGGREVKISKRAGTFITLEELVGEVGLDATRYFFLMYSPNTHMDFDMALAKERSQKNPVYYVQYARVRCKSILNKAPKLKIPSNLLEFLTEKEERNLVRNLIHFPEALAESARDYQVHRLTRYALELSKQLHDFYEKHRVITDDKKISGARLALTDATMIVLENILSLMGISAPDKM